MARRGSAGSDLLAPDLFWEARDVLMAWGGVGLFNLERLPARGGRVRTRAEAGRGVFRGDASLMAWVLSILCTQLLFYCC